MKRSYNLNDNLYNFLSLLAVQFSRVSQLFSTPGIRSKIERMASNRLYGRSTKFCWCRCFERFSLCSGRLRWCVTSMLVVCRKIRPSTQRVGTCFRHDGETKRRWCWSVRFVVCTSTLLFSVFFFFFFLFFFSSYSTKM